MKKVLVLVLVVVAGFFAYGVHKEKKAEAIVQEARNLMDNGEFDRAKVLLSDVLTSYPLSDASVLAEELHSNHKQLEKEYRRQIAKAERERQRKEDEKDEAFQWTEPTSSDLEPPPSLMEEREAEMEARGAELLENREKNRL